MLYTAHPSDALTMSNSNFILQMGNFNSFAGNKSNGSYKLSDTGGQLGPGLYSGSGYKVRAGFQYISSIIHFRFAVSGTSVDFGSLTATVPSTRTQTLTVSNGSAYGYQVTVSESHPLRVNSSGQEIPDTACDGTPASCTTTQAEPWTGSLVYGFGYNCSNISGADCDSQFLDATYYKPFAASPSAVTVMSSTTVGKNRQSQITYKVNISAAQSAGLYTNIINYIATPTF